MNPDLPLANYQELSDVLRDSSRSVPDRLNVRKKAVLAELESAHVLIYQQRVTQAIKAELARQKEEAERPKTKQNAQYVDHEREENTNNIIQHSILSTLDKRLNSKDIFEKPKEDPQDSAIKRLAFNAGQNTVSQDKGLARFRQRLDQIEQSGNKIILEAILDATYNVAVTAPHSAQEFLQTLDVVGAVDQVAYANLVSQLFRDQTGGRGGNQLLTRLQTITPKVKSKFDPFRQEEAEDPFSLIKKNRFENYSFRDKNEDHFRYKKKTNPFDLLRGESDVSTGLLRIGSRALDLNSLSLDIGLNSSFSYDLKLNGLDNWNANVSFFSELREIYEQDGTSVAHDWLAEANNLFAIDWSKGRDFAVKSRPTVRAYVKELGWTVSQLAEDYRNIGSTVFSVATITGNYEAVSKRRLSGVVRELIDDKDVAAIEALSKTAVPKEQVGTIETLLPNTVSNREFVSAITATGNIYQLCKNNNIDARFVTHRLTRLSAHGGLESYIKSLASVEGQLNDYARFANEQRANRDINLGFNDVQAQQTLELYVDFLGKSFNQFTRDFQATGTTFQRLPQIREKYAEFLDEDGLKSFMNYVSKQRSRDLINDLSQSIAPSSLIKGAVQKLGRNASKTDTVKALRELNKTYSFLSTVGATEILERRLSSIDNGKGFDATFEAIVGSRKECYSTVTGGQTVPENLTDMIDNVVIGYHKNTGTSYGVDIQPALRFITETYLANGSDVAFAAIRDHVKNQTVRNASRNKGVNVEGFEKGIRRNYHVSTAGDQLQRIRERIQSEFEQIYDRLAHLEISDEDISKLQEKSLKEQLEGVEKILGAYEFNEETKPFKHEIKGHIQTARSINGSMKEMETDASFYVSTDPIEALHMGQYFGSCLSLSKNHGGMNGWASVVQVMDANKNVIYARSEDGAYLGRNRTALTDQGILTTRFYQNGNMALENAWVSYLSDFADEVHQDVMIPTMFASSAMQSRLESLMQEGRVVKENRSVQIAPAYFNAFYGDGLNTQKLEDGSIKVDAEVYVVKTQNPIINTPPQQKKSGFLTKIFS